MGGAATGRKVEVEMRVVRAVLYGGLVMCVCVCVRVCDFGVWC